MEQRQTAKEDHVLPYKHWWGLLACAGLMGVILAMGPYSEGLVLERAEAVAAAGRLAQKLEVPEHLEARNELEKLRLDKELADDTLRLIDRRIEASRDNERALIRTAENRVAKWEREIAEIEAGVAAHDDADLARHVAMSPHLVARIGGILAEDAVRHDLAGSLYVAGDAELAATVARAVDEVEHPSLRAWSLGSRVEPAEAVSRIHLPVHDPRLESSVLLLSLTELGGYTLLARRVDEGLLLAYHAADLDLVDGLTTSLQSEYHLQPEER